MKLKMKVQLYVFIIPNITPSNYAKLQKQKFDLSVCNENRPSAVEL